MGILCKVLRNDYTESIHVAYAVAVDENGKVLFASGDPDYITFVRSSLKPFQAAAVVEKGATKDANFLPDELALMCASHNGEDIHVKTAQSMLNKLGLDASAYECGIHPPYDQDTRNQMLKDGKEWSALNNNCSGKHAGMLSLALKLGVDPAGYTKKDHPVQEKIFEKLTDLTGIQNFPTGIDGCNVPAPMLSLKTIAGLFQKLASGKDASLNTLFEAMTSHPYLVAGEKRFDTDFITALNGRAVTKVGGEAIRGVGIQTQNGESIGIAIKVLDGNQRAAPVATMKFLEHLKLLSNVEIQYLDTYRTSILKNHKQIEIGRIKADIEF